MFNSPPLQEDFIYIYMHLVEYINYEIKPTEEFFLIKPLREIWNADKTKTKEKAMIAISILYHLVDPRSSYNYIVDEQERFEEILIQEGLPTNYKIDEKLQQAIDIYKKHVITPGGLLVQRSLIAADKLGKFLEEIDLNAEDDKGKPKYTINSVASAIKQVPQLVKDLQEAQRMLSKEIEEEGRARGGNNSKTIFEDGFNF